MAHETHMRRRRKSAKWTRVVAAYSVYVRSTEDLGLEFLATSFTASTRRHLTEHHYRLSTFSRPAFSVAGQTVWNSLPDSLHDPTLSSDRF